VTADVKRAVVFDLDGVLVDSEPVWDAVRRTFVRDHGGRWVDGATQDMMGMSAPEWSQYLRDRLGVALPPDEIARRVAARVIDAYADRLPLLPGAQQLIRALAPNWELGLASSSNRSVIEVFLDASDLRDCFGATVSSEEVPRGKPAPDVYLQALHRLDVDAGKAVAVEDSSNGIRSAHAARVRVIALPNPHYPPTSDALRLASRVVRALDEVSPALESLWSCR
jgi:HAD superfamily hydrolase (TIGR01509 family)